MAARHSWSNTHMSRARYVVAAVVLAGGLLTACVVSAFLLGRSSVTHVEWRTGSAHIGVRQVSVESDGWTYGGVGSVPM